MRKSLMRGAGAALVAALTLWGATQPAGAAEPVSVRLKWLPQAQFAGIYVAKAKGFYEAGGLDVTVNPGGPNINVETLVASGADTFGIASGTEGVLYAREKGLPLVCIGMSQQMTPFAYVAYTESGINSVKDFKGKKVATWFTGPQYTLFSVLAHEGLAQSDLQVVSQPFSMQPFIDKQYDVATVTLYNELNTLKEQGITDIKLFLPDDSGVTTQQDSIVTSEKMIKEKPEQVQAFLDATLKGWKYAFEHKAEAVDIVLAAGSGLERKHQELMLDEIEKLMVAKLGTTEGLGAIDMKSIAAVQDSLVEFKAMKAPVDLAAAFDTTFFAKVPAEDKKM
ncbi:ABC transporter substrate-binding protein [Kaistia dalseonensis]|uniref:Thiamine pyrimidine synthase n=1 Tax=Kaistia dalseonensis TaxID=410840 RepID=A0ABU0HCR8_9HYPH|nr:ABC transporter substrate-binding protein [Kaistia dalseonensis]MCX5496691.1 ABC transporter substrate-binding protein [Kaistia dalseonensis]MDQ0439316.1 NitT/TauT family transport system substrate-binding protein [Kaistia dalseonensis]